MSVLDKFRGIFESKAPQRYYATIPAENVVPPDTKLPFEAEKTYLKVVLNDMYLAKRRVLYKTNTPVVHAFCSFLSGGKPVQIPMILGSSQIKELNNLENVLKLNYRIFGPVPFDGGEVELIVALFAVQTGDYGNKLLDVLGALSVFTGVGELKTSLMLLKPLKDGVEGLFGLNKYSPHIGVHDTFSTEEGAASPLSPGYRVVINTSEASMKGKALWVKGGRLMIGDSLEKAEAFTDADYILFKIQPLDKRDDWQSLNSVKESWDNTTNEASKSGDKDVDSAFVTFRGIVLNCPDLIWSDKVRIIDALQKRLDEIKAMKQPRVTRGPEMTAEEISKQIDDEMQSSLSKAISVEDARKKTLKDIPKSP